MTNEKFNKRKEEEEQLRMKLEIHHLEEMISSKSESERNEKKLIVGDRSFSLNEILTEANKGTSYGKLFLDTQAKLRNEKARRRG